MLRTRVSVRTVTGLNLSLAVLFISTIAIAAEDGKPAQRKRLAGLKPFTKEQMENFLSERRNAVIGTLNAKGDPQLTPVIFYWDGTIFYFTITQRVPHLTWRGRCQKRRGAPPFSLFSPATVSLPVNGLCPPHFLW